MAHNVTILTEDNVDVYATLYRSGAVGSDLIIIASATGVPKNYYSSFANYASMGRGFDVVTFDYRGIGKTSNDGLENDEIRMSDWGKYDLDAVINWSKERTSGRIFLLGHSIAGQIFPLAQHQPKVQAAYFVSSQTSSNLFWTGKERIALLLFFYMIIPMLTMMYGFFPAWSFGGQVHMPRGAALEWRKWGLHPNGIMQDFDTIRRPYASVSMPLHFLSISDDKMLAPIEATYELISNYSAARCSSSVVTPEEVGVEKIGHFGFFKDDFKETLWSMPINYFIRNR